MLHTHSYEYVCMYISEIRIGQTKACNTQSLLCRADFDSQHLLVWLSKEQTYIIHLHTKQALHTFVWLNRNVYEKIHVLVLDGDSIRCTLQWSHRIASNTSRTYSRNVVTNKSFELLSEFRYNFSQFSIYCRADMHLRYGLHIKNTFKQ